MRLLLLPLGGTPRTEGSAHLPALVVRLLLAAVQHPATLARPKSASSSLPLPSSSRLAACDPGKDCESSRTHPLDVLQCQDVGSTVIASGQAMPNMPRVTVGSVTWHPCKHVPPVPPIHHERACTGGVP